MFEPLNKRLNLYLSTVALRYTLRRFDEPSEIRAYCDSNERRPTAIHRAYCDSNERTAIHRAFGDSRLLRFNRPYGDSPNLWRVEPIAIQIMCTCHIIQYPQLCVHQLRVWIVETKPLQSSY